MHRHQVYKHFLTDKVLTDPRQRRFFRARDLSDLFTLGEEYGGEAHASLPAAAAAVIQGGAAHCCRRCCR